MGEKGEVVVDVIWEERVEESVELIGRERL